MLLSKNLNNGPTKFDKYDGKVKKRGGKPIPSPKPLPDRRHLLYGKVVYKPGSCISDVNFSCISDVNPVHAANEFEDRVKHSNLFYGGTYDKGHWKRMRLLAVHVKNPTFLSLDAYSVWKKAI